MGGLQQHKNCRVTDWSEAALLEMVNTVGTNAKQMSFPYPRGYAYLHIFPTHSEGGRPSARGYLRADSKMVILTSTRSLFDIHGYVTPNLSSLIENIYLSHKCFCCSGI